MRMGGRDGRVDQRNNPEVWGSTTKYAHLIDYSKEVCLEKGINLQPI